MEVTDHTARKLQEGKKEKKKSVSPPPTAHNRKVQLAEAHHTLVHVKTEPEPFEAVSATVNDLIPRYNEHTLTIAHT